MNPRQGVCIAAACAAIITTFTGCNNYGSTSTSPTPTPIPTTGPDTLYVQDASSKTVRVYLHASVLNGLAFASATLPTSDPSNPDVIYSSLYNVLFYPSAYPNQTIGPPLSTPIKIWNAPSTKSGMNPDAQVPYSNGQGTAAYDATHDLLYVANVNGPMLQVYKNAHVLTAGSVPAANITIGITDSGVVGTPRAQELLYDPVNDRLFVSDEGTVVASFDSFGAAAQAAVTSSTNPTIPASRQILGLSSPDGMAYNPANDILFVGEVNRKQINVIHNASMANGPNGHGQLITNFGTGPTGMAYDGVRDLLFVYDPLVIWVIPAPAVASGNVNNIVNRRQFFDSASELVGFGIAVDTTH